MRRSNRQSGSDRSRKGRSSKTRFVNLTEKYREMKRRGERVTALTAYDYPTARLLDESGLDVILVGDSVGMVVLGYEDTTQVTLDEMVHHLRAVARGVKRALVVADLPIHSYETPEQSLETARILIKAGAQAVKLEGGVSHVRQIEAIVSSGIPLMAHIGMLPQSVREEGGYKVKGRTQEQAEAVLSAKGKETSLFTVEDFAHQVGEQYDQMLTQWE